MPAATVTVSASSSTLMGKSAGTGFLRHSLGSTGRRMLVGEVWVTNGEGSQVLGGGGSGTAVDCYPLSLRTYKSRTGLNSVVTILMESPSALG